MKYQLQNQPIAITDSGFGGLSVFRAIQKALPNERLIYLADSKFAPYGEKPTEWIVERTLRLANHLYHCPCKMIVIACNTATAHAVHAVRTNFPIPVIGIEPGLKPACSITKTRKIGVLATQNTLKSEKFQNLLNSMPKEFVFFLQAGNGLVDLIEDNQIHSSKMRNLLYQYIMPMIEEEVDTLVLGCTHYPFLSNTINSIFNGKLHLIDTSNAVANQTKRMLSHHQLENTTQRSQNKNLQNNDQFFTTGVVERMEEFIKAHLQSTALVSHLVLDNPSQH